MKSFRTLRNGNLRFSDGTTAISQKNINSNSVTGIEEIMVVNGNRFFLGNYIVEMEDGEKVKLVTE